MHYYHFDALGSTRLLTDGDGDVTDKYAYDAWGTVVAHDRYEGSIDQPYQYVGQYGYYTHYQDLDFKLLQLGVRYYDPEIGRFTQMDPIKDGLNWYGYCYDNPIVYIDATGLKVVDFSFVCLCLKLPRIWKSYSLSYTRPVDQCKCGEGTYGRQMLKHRLKEACHRICNFTPRRQASWQWRNAVNAEYTNWCTGP